MTPQCATDLARILPGKTCGRLRSMEDKTRMKRVLSRAGWQRQQLGRCIADLAFLQGSERKLDTAAGEVTWSYTFTRAAAGVSLVVGGLPEGELVVASVEGEPGVAGFHAHPWPRALGCTRSR